MQEGLLKWGHPGDHVKTVHEGIFINYEIKLFKNFIGFPSLYSKQTNGFEPG